MPKKKQKIIVTAISLMAAIQRKSVKKTLLFGATLFLFFAFSSFAYATNYGAGNYGSGSYLGAGSDITPPVISAISSGTPSQTDATITWTTDEISDSQVQYGTTTSYGSTTTLDSNLVTSHSVPLTALTPNTTYHYEVISNDASANNSTSADQTFTTASIPIVSSGGGGGGGLIYSSPVGTISTTPTDCLGTTAFSALTGAPCTNYNTTINVSPTPSIVKTSIHSGTVVVRSVIGGTIIGHIANNVTGTVLQTVPSGNGLSWIEVQFPSATGWVSSAYVTEAITPTTASLSSITIPITGITKKSNAQDIKNLQLFLNWTLGSKIVPLVVDGAWGAKTTTAIKLFQKSNNLSADGAFGKLSAKKANELLGNK